MGLTNAENRHARGSTRCEAMHSGESGLMLIGGLGGEAVVNCQAEVAEGFVMHSAGQTDKRQVVGGVVQHSVGRHRVPWYHLVFLIKGG